VYFRQILHEDLGCASYLIADQGEAVVVDPKWEIADYLDTAERAGATIRHVLETHYHADHVSGRARLAAVTGARCHVPADPRRPESAGIRDGDRLHVGNVELRALASPGHRPEHLGYLVFDRARAGEDPWLLLSGDSLLVGDLARPDLAVDASEGARALWETTRRLESIGDHVELWPAHIGGSLCGSGSISPKPSSTLGYERRVNPLLSMSDSESFVRALTGSIPARPPTVERVVELNTRGAEAPPPLPQLDLRALQGRLGDGACVLDGRSPDAFDAGHLAGSLNLPATSRGLGTRAGWAVGLDEQIVVVADTAAVGAEIASRLQAAGLFNLAGLAQADPACWRRAGLAVRSAVALIPEQLAPRLNKGELRLVDVRETAEWRDGHIIGSVHLPLSALRDGRGVSLPSDRPLAVACMSGGRAALAASVLRRRDQPHVARVRGGIYDLARHGARLTVASS
jgi:hydroxyacylglutathione hydrolase